MQLGVPIVEICRGPFIHLVFRIFLFFVFFMLGMGTAAPVRDWRKVNVNISKSCPRTVRKVCMLALIFFSVNGGGAPPPGSVSISDFPKGSSQQVAWRMWQESLKAEQSSRKTSGNAHMAFSGLAPPWQVMGRSSSVLAREARGGEQIASFSNGSVKAKHENLTKNRARNRATSSR